MCIRDSIYTPGLFRQHRTSGILHEASITFLGFGLPPEQPAVGVIPVSYTHLDVYKRQVMSGQVDLAYTAASYSDQTLPGYELLSFETVDNRGFNLPACLLYTSRCV